MNNQSARFEFNFATTASIIISLMLCSFFSFSQASSEIYLFDLKTKKEGLFLSNGKNITDHKGYDNQPFFHPDEPIIYYSSFNEEGRADIKSYNYKTGETKNITTTNEREYSPTVTPDKKFLSCIIQRDNNAQDLGKYPIGGGEPVVLISDLIVGYHAWINEEQVMLFALGKPNTLQLYDLKTKEHEVIEDSIGRSIHKIPGEQAISYIVKKSEKEWVIKKYDPAAKASADIINALSGNEDITWTPDRKIIISADTKLFYADPDNDKEWTSITIDQPLPSKATRLAVSKDGKKLAIVVME
jgi:hypothetical protein